MLQRQVYRGGAGLGAAAARQCRGRYRNPHGPARDPDARADRAGRGAVNGVEQLRRRLEQINSDIEVARPAMSDLRARPPQPPPAADRRPPAIGSLPAAAGAPSPGAAPPAGADPPARRRPAGRGDPLSRRRPACASTGRASVRRPGGRRCPAAPPAEQYNHAFGLLKQADYPAAEEAFESFIAQHPNDPLAGSAQYWLGETYYARKQVHRSGERIRRRLQAISERDKGGRRALKLGMSLPGPTRNRMPASRLAQLDRDFPNAGARDQGAGGRGEKAAAAVLTRALPADRLDPRLSSARRRWRALGGFERRPLLAVAVPAVPTASRWRFSRIDGRASGAASLRADRRSPAAARKRRRGRARRRMARRRAAIRHAILDWAGDKPKTGIRRRRATARYRLLAAGAARRAACIC